ncbi:hypothetical protein HS7_11150 [Sulfolobales archaeon HS-7]|nr:hypothetical protein HS7_11150 [Sulfolobales archaeon HS-7]
MSLGFTVITGILTVVLSGFAAIFSIITFIKNERDVTYSDIDSAYMEVLKLGIEYPKFRDPAYTRNYKVAFKDPQERLQYETYAYIVWNLCETIYDRNDKVLFETWEPVIIAENKLHRAWLEEPENHHKFKRRFLEFVRSKYPYEK